MYNFAKKLLNYTWKFIEEFFAVQESVYVPPKPVIDNPLTTMPPTIVNQDWLDKLIEALIWVESRGDVNAIGDKGIPMSKGGPAYGILQIRAGVLSEVNAIWGKKYKGTDLLGETGAELSKLVCRSYFLSICPQYKSWKAGLAAGISLQEMAAKTHNGGVGWYLQSKKKGFETYRRNLEHYWALVQTKL